MLLNTCPPLPRICSHRVECISESLGFELNSDCCFVACCFRCAGERYRVGITRVRLCVTLVDVATVPAQERGPALVVKQVSDIT